MFSPESIWNLLWVNENFTHYTPSQVFLGAGGIFALFPDCRGMYKIIDSKLETGRFMLLSSCQIQIFESPELLAQELMRGSYCDLHGL